MLFGGNAVHGAFDGAVEQFGAPHTTDGETQHRPLGAGQGKMRCKTEHVRRKNQMKAKISLVAQAVPDTVPRILKSGEKAGSLIGPRHNC